MKDKINKIRSYELMITLHLGHIEFKFDIRPFVWYMPVITYRPKVKRNSRIVDGGKLNMYLACFRLWTFRTLYFGVGLDFAIARNPYFGRLSLWPRDKVILDLQ